MGFCRPSSGPSSGLQGSMMPSVDKSFSVWVIGSNMARLAPPTGLGIAQDDEVRVVAHVEAHGLQARLVDPDDRGAARRHLLLKRRQVDARGQQTQLGPLRTGPRLRDRTTGVVGAVGQGARRDRPAAPTPRP